MTYAGWSTRSGQRRSESLTFSADPHPDPPPTGGREIARGRERTSAGRASPSRYATRSAGCSGSTGTYAPPAFATPSTAATISTDRGSDTPTSTSGPTPRSISARARRFARAFSSRYDTSSSPHSTAIAFGVWRACASNSSPSVLTGCECAGAPETGQREPSGIPDAAAHGLRSEAMTPTFVVSTGRSGSTLVSGMVRLHPDVLSLSDLFVNLLPGAFPPGPLTGDAFWDVLGRPRRRETLMLRLGIADDEILYRLGPGARFTAETGVPPLLLTTLPHLTDAPEALLDAIEGWARGLDARPA